MENTKSKKRNYTKKSKEKKRTSKFPPLSEEAEEKQRCAGETSTKRTSRKGTKRKRSMKEGEERAASPVPSPVTIWPPVGSSGSSAQASCPQKMTPKNENIKVHKKIPIPPLPSKLPPVNLLHRDVVRAWCQKLKLSTKGLKLEAYKRLCEHAYPNQKDIPITPKEAKILTMSQRKLRMEKGEMILESYDSSKVIAPPEEGVPTLEGMDMVVMTSSASDAVFASWKRFAARAEKMEAEESPQEVSGVRWCVVHGRSLPADKEGWVQLQFYAGQTWVPEKQGRVCALFLLPACKFPPPYLEDNLLCPKCVRRNKVLMKSLQ